MRHLEVLVVTTNTTIPKVLNWKVSTVNNVETAIEKMQQQTYNVVAISEKFNAEDKRKLNQIITILYDDAIMVQFSSNDTLSQTVKAAYWRKNKPNAKSNYLDNAFEMTLANRLNSNK